MVKGKDRKRKETGREKWIEVGLMYSLSHLSALFLPSLTPTHISITFGITLMKMCERDRCHLLIHPAFPFPSLRSVGKDGSRRGS